MTDTCVEVNFPFGIQVSGSAGKPSQTFDPLGQLMIQLNGTLAGFAPVLRVVDAMKAIVDAIASIPSCIATLSPQKLIAKLEAVQAKLSVLLNVLPPASIPPLLRDIVSVLVMYLSGMRDMLASVQTSASLSAGLDTSALELELQGELEAAAELRGIAATSLQDNVSALATLSAQSCPYNHLIGTLKVVADLAGLPSPPTIPDFGGGAGASVDGGGTSADLVVTLNVSISVLDDAIRLLGLIQNVVGIAAFGGSASAALSVTV